MTKLKYCDDWENELAFIVFCSVLVGLMFFGLIIFLRSGGGWIMIMCDSHYIGGNCDNEAVGVILDGCGYPLNLCKDCGGGE